MKTSSYISPVELERKNARRRAAWTAAVVLAALCCSYLGSLVVRTSWAMDADEAVHAVEALRLYDSLAEGRLVDFLRDSYFPERWAPPVNPHVRWYPPIHAWVTLPAFALLGPSDVAARLPSVVLLFGTVLVFFALAGRLAPRHPNASGLVAVLLILSAPNLLTFSAQSLIEATALFFCFSALLAYLRSLESDHTLGRALFAGLVLSVAILSKYDHGGFLALSLGLFELIHRRRTLATLFRPGPIALFGTALLGVALWFAHPDKLDALKDSAAHPFYGTPRRILIDLGLTWITEYASSVAAGVAALMAFLWLALRLVKGHGASQANGRTALALNAVWLWALLSLLFYTTRGRFHFRYNFIEAPIFFLLLAAVLPTWGCALADRLVAPMSRRGLVVVSLAWLLSASAFGLGLVVAASPEAFFGALEPPLALLYDLRADHFGMTLAPAEYIAIFTDRYAAFAAYFGASVAFSGLAIFVLASTALVLAMNGRISRRTGRVIVGAAFLLATVPGAIGLYRELSERVDWELEGHPELIDVHDFVAANGGRQGSLLLGGGWDQLTNNALRWYLVTRNDGGCLPLADTRVLGDMIGSVVFPPEPRIAYWARRLAADPLDELPDRLVLIEPGADFLYRTRFGPEVELYRAVLAQRPLYRSLASRSFPQLDCEVEVLVRADSDSPALSDIEPLLEASGVLTDDPIAKTSRRTVGENGWEMRDESLRHFIARER